MLRIRNRLGELKFRAEIPKYIKFKKSSDKSNIVNAEKKKLYEFYKCDFCGDEIRLVKDIHKRSGGIVDFPQTLTKSGKITLALHNKCLNLAIKEFLER